jgi:hypothetical protein
MSQIKEVRNQSDSNGGFTSMRKPLITWSHGWYLRPREKTFNIFYSWMAKVNVYNASTSCSRIECNVYTYDS